MQEYIAMWKNYVNFSDRTTRRGYWMAVLFNVLAGIVIGIICQLLKSNIIESLYSLAILVPSLAICVRRLRDAGKKWTNLFFNLIPLVGWIIVIVLLCKDSIPDDGTPVV